MSVLKNKVNGVWIPVSSMPNALHGASNPTTSTQAEFIGQAYVNTSTQKAFVCRGINNGVYTWVEVADGGTTTEITSSSTDAQVPTAKAVYDDVYSPLKEEKADKDEVSNRNYLDNPFFTINQRGATTYTVGEYGVDRWKLVSGTATVSGSQITLNGTLRQILEFPLGTNDFKCSVICASRTATATYDDTTKYFDITSSGGVIKCAKLELGSVSTLAMDTAPNYAEEMLKCQRYFQLISKGFGKIYGHGFSTDSTSVHMILALACPMASLPSLVLNDVILGNYHIDYEISNITIGSFNCNDVEFYILTPSVTNGASFVFYNTTNSAIFYLTCEL